NEFANRRWHEYTGLRSEDTVGRGWQAVFHPDDIDEHVEKWRASLASGQLFENEARLRRAADGVISLVLDTRRATARCARKCRSLVRSRDRYRGSQACRAGPAAERDLFGGRAEDEPHGQLGIRGCQPTHYPFFRRTPPLVWFRSRSGHADLG